MPVKLLLDSNKIYHKEFIGNKPGYDSLQVDSFLDIVIKDYETVEDYVNNTDKKISELENKVKMLNEEVSALSAENVNLKTKIGDINVNSDTSLANLELIKRISALEKALSRAGINPNTIE